MPMDRLHLSVSASWTLRLANSISQLSMTTHAAPDWRLCSVRSVRRRLFTPEFVLTSPAIVINCREIYQSPHCVSYEISSHTARFGNLSRTANNSMAQIGPLMN